MDSIFLVAFDIRQSLLVFVDQLWDLGQKDQHKILHFAYSTNISNILERVLLNIEKNIDQFK